MTYNVTVIPGDGIGPEVTDAACRVLEATGVKFNWDTYESGYIRNVEMVQRELEALLKLN